MLEIRRGAAETKLKGRRTWQRPHRRVLAAIASLALGLIGVLAWPGSASAFDEGTIHSLVNQSRAAAGLGPLTLNPSLSQVAADWADQMAAQGSLGHNPDYSTQIPGGWSRSAENVAQGYPSGSAVHQGWMASPGHRANVLGDFTDIGLAHISAGGTTWSVEVFAKYGSAAPPAPAAKPAPAPKSAPAPQPAPAPPSAAPAPSPPASAPPAPTAKTRAAAPTATPQSPASAPELDRSDASPRTEDVDSSAGNRATGDGSRVDRTADDPASSEDGGRVSEAEATSTKAVLGISFLVSLGVALTGAIRMMLIRY